MDRSLKGTLTEQNLLKAFAGESQAKNRYTFFAEVARKEGYEQIAGIFTRRLYRKRLMRNVFSVIWKAGWLRLRRLIRPGRFCRRS